MVSAAIAFAASVLSKRASAVERMKARARYDGLSTFMAAVPVLALAAIEPLAL